MTTDAEPLPPGVRTYYLRRGRLTAEHRALVATLLAQYGLPAGPLEPAELFGGLPVALEIGFGMGEATVAMAQHDPGTGIVAVDVHTPGVLRLLREVRARGLTNVRVAHEDALALLQQRVRPATLDEIRVYFPDPWPKARHHKRRLVQPAVLALLASRLRTGGRLHLATDVAAYAAVMRKVSAAEPALRLVGHDRGARPRTRYEHRGRAAHRAVTDLVLARR